MLLGRTAEESRLRGAVARAGARVVVHGEAGVGKTSLVSSVLADPTRSGSLSPRIGGALATLAWLPYLPLRRAFPELREGVWDGDADFVAGALTDRLGIDEVLLLEDLHWADAGTLQVLDLLAGRSRLVATVRRGDPAAPDVLARLVESGAEVVHLEPLGTEDAAALAARVRPGISDAELASVLSRSGGNPLLVEELAVAGGDTASLELAMLARCRALPDAEVDGLAMLALAGRPLPVVDVPGSDSLVEAGLLSPTDAGVVGIRHALIGEVVTTLLSPERVERCHRALAEVVTHPGERARHLMAAGDREAAYEQAMQAVEESATPGERWRHLVIAAEAAPATQGQDLALRAIDAASRAGEPAAVARIVEGLDGEMSAAVAIARATHAFELGETEHYLEQVRAGLAVAVPGSSEEVQLLVKLATGLKQFEGDPRRGLEVALEAVARAEAGGHSSGAAAKVVADCMTMAGKKGWEPWYDRAHRAALAEGNTGLEVAVAYNRVYGHVVTADFDTARQVAERMAQRCAELQLTRWQRAFEGFIVQIAGNQGDHAYVLREIPRLLASATRPTTVLEDKAVLALALAETGRTTEALEMLEDLAGSSSHQMLHIVCRLLVMFQAGDAEGVLEGREELLASADLDPYLLGDTLAPVAWSAWDLGVAAVELPEPVDTPFFAGVRAELEGIAALHEGRFADAAELFDDAVRLHAGHHRRDEVHCTWAAAEARRLAGDPTAESTLRTAEQVARESGMAATLARCERSLRAMGVRRAANPRHDGSPLSSREHQVALLAVEGLTDREIAARLGVAHRTVQTHVASARRKLGAASRTHLVAIVSAEQP